MSYYRMTIGLTDRLIVFIVYRMYGLTEEDVVV
jgi:hypothetical protein